MIPLIDLSAFRPDEAGEGALAAAIGAAARGPGFFTIAGHGLAPALVESVFAEAKRFFDRPVAEKEAFSIRHSPHNRGYVGLGAEALDPTKGADRKEAFNIGLELAADDPEILAGVPFRGLNLWPADGTFKDVMLAYFDAVFALGRRLHRPIARDLGLAPDYFEDKLDRPLATLRLLRYPPAGPDGEASNAGEHTDYGNLTLLLTDDAGGLEVRNRDGQWLPVPHNPGAFIVNIGDCLMRWTNDIYVSTPHRVTHRAPRARISIAFFLDPNPEATVAALPGTFGPERPARYPPISGAAYLRERLDATYAHRQEERQIA